MRTLTWFGVVVITAGALLAACSSAPPSEIVVVPGWAAPPNGTGSTTGPDGGPGQPPPSQGQDGGTTPPPSGSDGGTAAAMGVPCDVATVFANSCTGCHSDPPIGGSLAGLVTYSDLMATSHEVPSLNEVQDSVARMQSSSSPMPPGGGASAADITTLQNWINAGYPMGSCGGSGDGGAGGEGGSPPPPLGVFQNAPPFSPHTGNTTHNAGQDCLNCHNGTGDPDQFSFGGTVYDGNGNPVVGAEVRMIDANGTATSVYTGPNGTFYKTGTGFAAPAHIGVRNASSMANMLSGLQASGGGCSSCHCTGSSCTVTPIHLP